LGSHDERKHLNAEVAARKASAAKPSPAATSNRRTMYGPQFVGVWIGDRYISLRGPKHMALFSERNRIKCRVVPLLGGWRLVVREG
jgi:hypothetical protein